MFTRVNEKNFPAKLLVVGVWYAQLEEALTCFYTAVTETGPLSSTNPKLDPSAMLQIVAP